MRPEAGATYERGERLPPIMSTGIIWGHPWSTVHVKIPQHSRHDRGAAITT